MGHSICPSCGSATLPRVLPQSACNGVKCQNEACGEVFGISNGEITWEEVDGANKSSSSGIASS